VSLKRENYANPGASLKHWEGTNKTSNRYYLYRCCRWLGGACSLEVAK